MSSDKAVSVFHGCKHGVSFCARSSSSSKSDTFRACHLGSDAHNGSAQLDLANNSSPLIKSGKLNNPRSNSQQYNSYLLCPDSIPVKPEASQDTPRPSTTVEPLAPPPKPSQTQTSLQPAVPSIVDYANASRHPNTHFSLEPNPFEQSFGNPATDTPGKSLLPPLASLTSPTPIGLNGTPGWHNSLRSGPLSPAMLSGPNYFDDNFRASFPTPNESSLRSGLTPGGGGSMFSAPSPSSQAIFNTIQSGGATPGTLEFHSTLR